MNLVTVAAPDKLVADDRHTAYGMLRFAQTQTVIARQFPTTIYNTQAHTCTVSLSALVQLADFTTVTTGKSGCFIDLPWKTIENC